METEKIDIEENNQKYLDNELFSKLKKVRMEFARIEEVPAYIVFNDATLVEMVKYLPKNEKEFLNISGVGEVKLEKYGNGFLNTINKYIYDTDPKELLKKHPESITNKDSKKPFNDYLEYIEYEESKKIANPNDSEYEESKKIANPNNINDNSNDIDNDYIEETYMDENDIVNNEILDEIKDFVLKNENTKIESYYNLNYEELLKKKANLLNLLKDSEKYLMYINITVKKEDHRLLKLLNSLTEKEKKKYSKNKDTRDTFKEIHINNNVKILKEKKSYIIFIKKFINEEIEFINQIIEIKLNLTSSDEL